MKLKKVTSRYIYIEFVTRVESFVAQVSSNEVKNDVKLTMRIYELLENLSTRFAILTLSKTCVNKHFWIFLCVRLSMCTIDVRLTNCLISNTHQGFQTYNSMKSWISLWLIKGIMRYHILTLTSIVVNEIKHVTIILSDKHTIFKCEKISQK
jgi:hypothetical protein